jgi:hypothetical protein
MRYSFVAKKKERRHRTTMATGCASGNLTQYCDEVTNGTLTFPAVKRDQIKIYVFGNDTVEEWWRDTSTMVYKGKTSHGPRKCSVVYSRVGGRWLDVAHMTSLYTVEQ